jgi:hypothetical protein
MTIIERSRVLHAYLRALRSGVDTQEQAVAMAAEELCLPQEAVVDVVGANEAEVLL